MPDNPWGQPTLYRVRHGVRTETIEYKGQSLKIVLSPEREIVGIYDSFRWVNGRLHYNVVPIDNVNERELVVHIERKLSKTTSGI